VWYGDDGTRDVKEDEEKKEEKDNDKKEKDEDDDKEVKDDNGKKENEMEKKKEDCDKRMRKGTNLCDNYCSTLGNALKGNFVKNSILGDALKSPFCE